MVELDLSNLQPPAHGMTRREAALFLGVSEETLRAWEHAGTGPALIRISARKAVYPRDALTEFLAAQTRGGTPR
jgi:predicted site-specific integrase-resolvase